MNSQILLAVTPEQLDFISRRMSSGKMTFTEAKNVNDMLQMFVAQANNPELQAKLNPPSSPPAPAPEPAKIDKADAEKSNG